MADGLQWAKVRLDATTRSVLDRAVTHLGRALALNLHLVKHPSGKLIAFRVEDLWFCRVGDGGHPPRTWTLAIDTRPEPRTLLPAQNDEDFAECCDLLGFRTAEQQDHLRAFLLPDPDPTAASPGSGAF